MNKLLLILFLITSFSAIAQKPSGANELLLPTGAKSLAMSNSGTASITGIEAIYYNPAGIPFNSSTLDAQFSHLNFIADIGMSYLAVISNFGSAGTAAISVKNLDVGDIPVTTTQQPYGTGEVFSPTLLIAGFSYGKSLSDNISGGLNLNIVYEKIGRSTATGIAFDFGIQYADLIFDNLRLGLVVKNAGPLMKYEGPDLLRTAIDSSGVRGNSFYNIEAEEFELPLYTDIGVSYSYSIEQKYRMLINGGYSFGAYTAKEIRTGAEFSYDDLFFIRGGLNYTNSQNSEYLFGPSFGIGINVNTFFRLSVDYAYRVVKYFKPNQLITVKVSF